MSEAASAAGAKRLAWPRVAERFKAVPPEALAYGLPSLVAVVAVQMWFRLGGVLASGDLTPPVVPGTDYRSHWNQFDTGAGAPSFQIVSLPYFEGLRLFAKLGLGEGASQRVWLTLLAAGASAAVVFLARGVVRSPLAVGVAGLLATFNAYRLTTTFDSIPLMAVIAAAVLGGLVIRAGGERGARPLVFALASLTCAYVFLNPPHLALVAIWVAASALVAVAVHGRRAAGRLGRFLLGAAPLTLLFNLWWIVPATLSITSPVFHARFAAAGVEDWAWTQVRASPENVLALTSSWAWGRPEYFPFSPGLERFPFTVLQYLPLAAAAGGLLLARGRRLRVGLVLAVVGLVTAWAMKGLHSPLGATNRWFYDHAPGFWLLREPTKAALVLVLVYALLAALGVDRLVAASRRLAYSVAAAVVAGAVAYAHPLLSGAVVPNERPLLPSAHVRMPQGWRAAETFIDRDAAPGKIVVLPRLDYYQAPTNWGYYGATFLHQLIRRPVIDAPLPGGYYRDRVVPDLLTQLEDRVLKRTGGLGTLLQALGARYILLRRDLELGFPGRVFASPDLLAERLEQRRDVRLVRSFGVADLFAARTVGAPELYPAVPLRNNAGGSIAAVEGAVDVGRDVAVVSPAARRLLTSIPAGQIRLLPPARAVRERLVAEIENKRVRLRVAGSALRGARRTRMSVATPSPPYRLSVGSRRFLVGRARTRLRSGLAAPADVGLRRGFLPPEPIALTPALARRVGDCHKSDPRGLRAVGIAARVIGAGRRATVRLEARAHSACVAIRLSGFPPPRALRLRLGYRTLRGNAARVCVWQVGPDRCAPQPALAASAGWHRLDATVHVARGTQSLRLFLYADAGHRRTRTAYRGIAASRPIPAIGVAVAPIVHLPRVSYRRVSPSEFRISVRRARRPFLLVLAETFARGWKLHGPRGVSGQTPHLRVNGYANGWRVPWTGSYELRIEYAPERLARFARRLDLIAIPFGIVALLWPRRRRLVPRRRTFPWSRVGWKP